MFELKQVNSEKDLLYCVNVYASANDESFIPVHKETAINYLSTEWRTGSFLRIIVKDGNPVGVVLASKGPIASHSNLKAMTQRYYYCTLQGFSAAKAAIFVHRELEKEAIRLRLPLVVSTGSHLDETNQFTRILEKIGWERRGYIAVKKLTYK